MRKVLFMCYALRIGGTEQVLATVLRYLDQQAFKPVVVTYSRDRGYPLPDGISHYALGIQGGGRLVRKLAVNLLAVLRLRRILRQERPDIAVGTGAMSNWALILAAKLTPEKMVIVVGEHGVGATEIRSDRITANIIRLLNRFLYPLADRVISVSEGVRQYLLHDLKLPETKVISISNPVDVEAIKRLSQEPVNHPWLVSKNRPVILWVGRIETTKGLQYLIGAFERVLTEIDARLIIVGEGSDQRRIHDLVTQKGLQEKVQFTGYDPNPYRYMSRSDVFAFPSLCEGFGLVLAEAMACGLPVVSADCVAGPAEILENGRCGILVPVGDEKSLANGILRILTDSVLREGLIRAGARRVADFQAAHVVASYERLFREVCEEQSSGDSLAVGCED